MKGLVRLSLCGVTAGTKAMDLKKTNFRQCRQIRPSFSGASFTEGRGKRAFHRSRLDGICNDGRSRKVAQVEWFEWERNHWHRLAIRLLSCSWTLMMEHCENVDEHVLYIYIAGNIPNATRRPDVQCESDESESEISNSNRSDSNV